MLAEVNDSRLASSSVIFLRAHQAWNKLEVGGAVIGDTPSWRDDQMPYGWVKDSGLGREEIRYAMEEMSEIRLMVIRNV